MSGHTPGPWTPVECDGNADDLAIADNDGGYVCYSVATLADAELIAAAPELLAALHLAADALDYAQAQVDSENDAHNLRVRLVQVKRVIAKAEGQGS